MASFDDTGANPFSSGAFSVSSFPDKADIANLEDMSFLDQSWSIGQTAASSHPIKRPEDLSLKGMMAKLSGGSGLEGQQKLSPKDKADKSTSTIRLATASPTRNQTRALL